MKPLFDISSPENLVRTKSYPFECEQCSVTFFIEGNWVQCSLRNKNNPFRFCTTTCSGLYNTKSFLGNCSQCNTDITIRLSDKRKSKSGRMFCSRSCSGTYNNTHKTTGTRRSKLECWLQVELDKLYPLLKIEYNSIIAINNELDIYIPNLNLAIEINGIFHYKPIYGLEKLSKTQATDKLKIDNCIKSNITLIVIDISTYQRFSIKTAQPFLTQIQSIINSKQLAPEEVFETPT